MNDYMRENKIEPVAPSLNTETVAHADAEGKRARADKAAEKPVDRSAEKGSEKSSDKPRTKDGGAVGSEKSRKSDS